MQIAFRPALTPDFGYCKRLYFSGMNKIVEELNLDKTAQAAGLEQQWILTEVQISTCGGSDVGCWDREPQRSRPLGVRLQRFASSHFRKILLVLP